MQKKKTNMANSLAGYIALLRQLALLCKVGSAIAAAIARCNMIELSILKLLYDCTNTFVD